MDAVVQTQKMYMAAAEKARLPGIDVMRFAELVSDMTAGLQVLHSLRETQHLREANPDTVDEPLMTDSDLQSLNRFERASLEMLERESGRIMDWAYDFHTTEGQERRRRYRAEL
jgi:hypothetical protein